MVYKNRELFPVSIVNGISPTVQKVITFGELITEMKSRFPKEKANVLKLRSEKINNPTAYQKKKEKLPGFVIGEFSKRNDKSCTKYVPCLAFDLDGIGESMAGIILSDLKKIPYVFSAFLSPGAGLRVLVWCATNQNSHKAYYKAFCEHLSNELGDYIKTDAAWIKGWKKENLSKEEIKEKLKITPHVDTSTSNISRLWFYVPLPKSEIYLNLDSRVFYLPEIEEKPSQKKTQKPIRPQTKNSPASNGSSITENEKFEMCLLMANERFKGAGRNEFVFNYACLCFEHGITKESIYQNCLQFIEPDFTESEILKTVNSAVKQAKFQKFTDENLLNYKKMRSDSTVNGSRPAKKNGSTKEDEKQPPEKKSQSGKKNKFLQIEEHLFGKYDFRRNIISIDIEYRKKGKGEEFKDLNENNLFVELKRMGFTGVENDVIALLKSDLVQEYDPFLDYKKSLSKWDESKPDYITQLANYVNAKDQHWFNTQFKKMLVRAGACALNIIPFNKQCFTMLGKQNDGKSSFLRFLCPPSLRKYFKEDLDFNNKDGRLALCSNFFINLDELASLSKYELNKIKTHFTVDQVKERLPYDRKSSVFPRRATFLASTNEDEFLTDSTGNVRWLVLEINGIKHDNGGANGYSQNIDIDLVWSQVFYLLDNGFDFKLGAEEIRKSELNNKQHKVTTLEQELVQGRFSPATKEEHDEFIPTREIFKELEIETRHKISIQGIGRAMRNLGFEVSQKYLKEYNGKPANYQKKGYYVYRLKPKFGA
ncbi:MAG: VapE domain-containing protein [Bacteroidota bacterium]